MLFLLILWVLTYHCWHITSYSIRRLLRLYRATSRNARKMSVQQNSSQSEQMRSHWWLWRCELCWDKKSNPNPFESGDIAAIITARARPNKAVRLAKRAHRHKIQDPFQDQRISRRRNNMPVVKATPQQEEQVLCHDPAEVRQLLGGLNR